MFDSWTTIAAGALFGAGGGLLLVGSGQTPGISGIVKGALSRKHGDLAWRVVFLLGLLLGGRLAWTLAPQAFVLHAPVALPWVLVSGLCIGVGARLANGCTSGHGVCGIGRWSPRSLVATATFTVSGAIAHLAWTAFGGAS
ncbi:MAG TPA: YeeE/YedE thiosulfate transporter family protein [Polyangiaceae bacterium]|jgi:uncharacterized membrane protein YedE/YeeE|nr:YeeE/YedE thiosulfate transporter family protein [Polyangiaceae bacterium]